ncbi:hypothetical protein ACFV0C_38470 [Streptomyces sp. NPDC059568]
MINQLQRAVAAEGVDLGIFATALVEAKLSRPPYLTDPVVAQF